MFWLKSIDSFGDTKTPVLVVGTHADQVSENVSLSWIATLNFYFMDLKISILKHDFVIQRRMYALNYFKIFSLFFFYEKVENLFWLQVIHRVY